MSTNNIAEFYRDATVLITGATGFVGKVLLEKLLWSCNTLDAVVVLVRPKRGKGVDERLAELLKSPVFGRLRERAPERFSKIRILHGDIAEEGLGLSEADKSFLLEKINIVLHSAASVRFNDNLKQIISLNTLGTKQLADLCTQMKHLKSFVYVSTAFSNAHRQETMEVVYEPPYDPNFLLTLVKALPSDVVQQITPTLIGSYPNVYILSKALTEVLLREYFVSLPLCIVRPSIVSSSWREPFPGWVDSYGGATGLVIANYRGILWSVLCDESTVADLVPVDVVANTIIAAGWHSVSHRSTEMLIYNCTSGAINPVTWRQLMKVMGGYSSDYPTQYAIMNPHSVFVTSRLLHRLMVLLHYVPAFIYDFYLLCTKRKPIMRSVFKKVVDVCEDTIFVVMTHRHFSTVTFSALVQSVSQAEDGHDFNIDMCEGGDFDWASYFKDYVLGIRQYMVHDDISSLDYARAKQKRLYWITKIIQAVLVYILFRIVFW